MENIEINAYTDGACSRNGRPDAKAGIGIFFKENDSRNYCARIGGKQTNNRAELIAILTTIDILKREIQAGCKINIYSDSTYAMRCCGEYGEKLYKKNWESKKPIPNLELIKQSYNIFKNLDNVYLKYIAAHTGLQDVHSIGNEQADKLANFSIGVIETNDKKTLKKIYIKLPYSEKEEGKKLGCRWDPKKKKWYIPPNLDLSKKEIILSKWGQ
jgi:ribonuclease HI